MRAKDLRKYKTLDITELSGSPWNNAEKVLGLDENDKVLMAEPDGVVTPEDIADAIASETARTEETYIKQEVIPEVITGSRVGSDGDYDMLEFVKSDTTTGDVIAMQRRYIKKINGVSIISPYREDNIELPTEESIEYAISQAMESETARTEDIYAKKSEVPVADDYYTKDETDGAISTALVPYATKGWVSSQSYANQNYVMFKVNEAMQIETARTESTYAKPSDIPSLDGYATEDWVEGQGYLTEHQDLSAYAKTTAVTQDIQTAMAAETARTESTYLKEHQSLDNYYTKSEVDADFVSAATEVGNAIDAAVDGLASETYVDNAVSGLASEDYVDSAVTSATEGMATQEYVDNAVAGIDFPDDYATTGDVASAVEGLASESYVDDAITSATQGMATQSDLEGLASESYVDDAVNGVVQGIGMLGMVNDVSEDDGTVTVQKTTMQEGQLVTGSTSFNIATPGDIQTAIASETARTESTYLKEHQSLDNYYTKSQVDAEITGATEDMATKTWVGQQGYLTQHQDLSAYAKTTAVTEDIASAMAAETARTENTYAKPSQIPSLSGYATETYVDTAIASETARTESTYLKEHQDISGKLDKTDFDTYTGATQTVLAGKLDATAYTIDNTIDSASTNPVENRAINVALNGVTSSTQMEISSVDSSVQIQYRVYGDSSTSSLYVYLKETNIDDFYAISIKDLVDGVGVSNPYRFRVNYFIYNNNYYRLEYTKYIETSDVGEKLFCTTAGGGSIYIENSRLDGTFGYYLVFNTDGEFCSIYKTLPVITEVTDHKANVSDVPTAQDKTNFNQFVYAGEGTKMVVRGVYGNEGQQILSSGRRSCIDMYLQPWGGIGYESSSPLQYPKGNECVDGIKTVRDSQIISRAEEALNGFDENITLTIGNQSSDTIQFNWNNYNLYETDNSRYLVLEVSGIVQSDNYISQVTLSGTNYYVDNPMITRDNYRPVTGSYQLVTTNNDFRFSNLAGNNYIIIDKQLLTLRIADSLTITRAKNIQEALDNIPQPDMSDYVSKDELTGTTIETPITYSDVDDTNNYITCRDSSNRTPYTLYGHLIDGETNKYVVPLSGVSASHTEIEKMCCYANGSQAKYANGITYSQSDLGVAIPITGGSVGGEGKFNKDNFDGTFEYYIILDAANLTATLVKNLPTASTEVPGVLDDYYTKTEIDGMIGDIESLLASI